MPTRQFRSAAFTHYEAKLGTISAKPVRFSSFS